MIAIMIRGWCCRDFIMLRTFIEIVFTKLQSLPQLITQAWRKRGNETLLPQSEEPHHNIQPLLMIQPHSMQQCSMTEEEDTREQCIRQPTADDGQTDPHNHSVADRGPLCTEQSMLYCWVDIKLRSQSSNVLLLIIAVRNQVGGHIRGNNGGVVGFIHKSAVSHEWCHTVFVSLVFFKHFGC